MTWRHPKAGARPARRASSSGPRPTPLAADGPSRSQQRAQDPAAGAGVIPGALARSSFQGRATVAAPSRRNGTFSLDMHLSRMSARSLVNPSSRQSDPQRVAGRFGASVSLHEDKAKVMPNGVGDLPVLKRAAPPSVGDPGARKPDPPTVADRFRGPTCFQQSVARHVAARIRSEPSGAPCSRGDAFLAGHRSGFIGRSRCPSCGYWEKSPGVDFKGRPLMNALRS